MHGTGLSPGLVWGVCGVLPGVPGAWGVTSTGPGMLGTGSLGCTGVLGWSGGVQKVHVPGGNGAAGCVTVCVTVTGPVTDGLGFDTVPPVTIVVETGGSGSTGSVTTPGGVGTAIVRVGPTGIVTDEERTGPFGVGAPGFFAAGPVGAVGVTLRDGNRLSPPLGGAMGGKPENGVHDIMFFPALRSQYASSFLWHACTCSTCLAAVDLADRAE